MEFLISFLIAIIIVGIILLLANWAAHVSMTKDNCKKYGWGTFKDFKIMFDRQDWEIDEKFQSLFVYDYYLDTKSKIHADIYKFEGKGMLLNPIAFYRSKIYIKNYIEDNVGSKKCVKWKEITNRGG